MGEYEKVEYDLKEWVNRKVRVRGVTDKQHCPTGEDVITLTSGGIKPQCEPMEVYCSTVGKAIELFKYEFQKYQISKQHLEHHLNFGLYWRIFPQIVSTIKVDQFTDESIELFAVRARLILTDKEESTEYE